jgi:hypothetical protein
MLSRSSGMAGTQTQANILCVMTATHSTSGGVRSRWDTLRCDTQAMRKSHGATALPAGDAQVAWRYRPPSRRCASRMALPPSQQQPVEGARAIRGSCVGRQQRVAIAAGRARALPSARRDRPPQPSLEEGARPAAHVCAASGASRLRQDEHAPSVSYRSLLEAELAHRAATAGAIRTWPVPLAGPPSRFRTRPPRAGPRRAQRPIGDRCADRPPPSTVSPRPGPGPARPAANGPGAAVPPPSRGRSTAAHGCSAKALHHDAARLEPLAPAICALFKFPYNSRGLLPRTRGARARSRASVLCIRLGVHRDIRSSLFLIIAASRRSLNCSFC